MLIAVVPHTPYSQFPIPDSRFPTPYSLLPIPYKKNANYNAN
ncbi:hypothetical protein [Moorena producens]